MRCPMAPSSRVWKTRVSSSSTSRISWKRSGEKDGFPWRTEYVIYDEELDVAGSVDIILQRVEDVEEQARPERRKLVRIKDWKRSKKIDKASAYKKTYAPPLDHLDYCEYNKYSIQLYLYKYLMTKNYYVDVDEMSMLQMHPKQPGFQEQFARPMDMEVDMLLGLRRDYLAAKKAAESGGRRPRGPNRGVWVTHVETRGNPPVLPCV